MGGYPISGIGEVSKKNFGHFIQHPLDDKEKSAGILDTSHLSITTYYRHRLLW